jgi:hypothetical protein
MSNFIHSLRWIRINGGESRLVGIIAIGWYLYFRAENINPKLKPEAGNII